MRGSKIAASISKNTAFGGGGGGCKYGGGLDRKQLNTMRLLASPPPPCGSFVNIPRSTATADTTSPATSMIADVFVECLTRDAKFDVIGYANENCAMR